MFTGLWNPIKPLINTNFVRKPPNLEGAPNVLNWLSTILNIKLWLMLLLTNSSVPRSLKTKCIWLTRWSAWEWLIEKERTPADSVSIIQSSWTMNYTKRIKKETTIWTNSLMGMSVLASMIWLGQRQCRNLEKKERTNKWITRHQPCLLFSLTNWTLKRTRCKRTHSLMSVMMITSPSRGQPWLILSGWRRRTQRKDLRGSWLGHLRIKSVRSSYILLNLKSKSLKSESKPWTSGYSKKD